VRCAIDPIMPGIGAGQLHHQFGALRSKLLRQAARRRSITMVHHKLVTTAFELPGYRLTQTLGVVRGIVVRSRSVVGNIGASIQIFFGGNITLYTDLCERARADAYELMIVHAGEMGANAIIGVRYDANEVVAGVTEVLAYGTAVVAEPA
jgi:uncharacterized protein YbjQ (UPF0145 family)